MTNRRLIVAALLTGAACSSQQNLSREAPFESVELGEDSPADQLSSARIIENIELRSTIEGRFNPRVRTYGFTFEAKAGAIVDVGVATKAGSDSGDATPGSALDTVIGVYGPINSNKKGPKLFEADDDGDDVQAQLAPLTIAKDGRYLVVMSTWNDPGAAGSYKITVGCKGTDFQCRRPVQNAPCSGQRFIQGGQTVSTTTWNECKVVLLEPTIVEAGAVLTINPGVRVEGNFLGTGNWGTVSLNVKGTIQAVGTKQHPVVFTALKTGWAGIMLENGTNTFENVYIEKAQIGVQAVSSGNTFKNVNINTVDWAMAFRAGSFDNVAQNLVITQANNGIFIDGGSVSITDTVISGKKSGTGNGIQGNNAQRTSHFLRAVVSGFADGLNLNATELEVTDSTIASNTRGVTVTGPNAGVTWGFEACPSPEFNPPPAVTWPTLPTTWGRDPVFIRTDIINNTDYAIRINAPELLVVEDSNIRGNGRGIVIEANSLHPQSHIVRTNIFDNGPMTNGVRTSIPQVDTSHRNGVLDISSNYWFHISDPELGATRITTHRNTRVCEATIDNAENRCGWNGTHRTCGAYLCQRSAGRQVCPSGITQTAEIQSNVRFTGFSPVELTSGPKKVDLCDEVRQERGALGLAD